MNRLRYRVSFLNRRGSYWIKPLMLLFSLGVFVGLSYIISIAVVGQAPVLLQGWEWMILVIMEPVMTIDTYVANEIISMVLALLGLYIMLYVLLRFSPSTEATLKVIVLIILGLIVYRLYGGQ